MNLTGNKYCTKPWTESVLEADGRVHPCANNSMVMGDWKLDGIAAVWQGAKYRKFRSSVSNKEFPNQDCENCYQSGLAKNIYESFVMVLREALDEIKKCNRCAEPDTLTMLIETLHHPSFKTVVSKRDFSDIGGESDIQELWSELLGRSFLDSRGILRGAFIFENKADGLDLANPFNSSKKEIYQTLMNAHLVTCERIIHTFSVFTEKIRAATLPQTIQIQNAVRKLTVFEKILRAMLVGDESPEIVAPTRKIQFSLKCNVRCIHCPLTFRKVEETLEISKACIPEVFAGPEEILAFSTRTGELLQYPHWKDVIAYLERYGLKLYLYTNGSLLTQANIRYLLDRKVLGYLCVSLDGARAEIVERIRKKIRFDVLKRNIRFLFEYASKTKSDLHLDFACMLMQMNYRELPDVVRLISTLRSGHSYPRHVTLIWQSLNASIDDPGYKEFYDRQHHANIPWQELMDTVNEALEVRRASFIDISFFSQYTNDEIIENGYKFPRFIDLSTRVPESIRKDRPFTGMDITDCLASAEGHAKEGAFVNAVKDYLAGLWKFPDHEEFYQRILALNIRDKHPELLGMVTSSYREIIKNHPDNIPARIHLSRYLYAAGSNEEAVHLNREAMYHRLMRENPVYLKNHWNRGSANDPDFMIIGAMKSGTSSLYEDIAQHPKIVPPISKELYFLSEYYSENAEWWYSQFPPISEGSGYITGEGTPFYLYYPGAAKRLHKLLPGVKIIVLLRNPVDRAYSSHYHWMKQGLETSSFKDTVYKEMEELEIETGLDPRGDRFAPLDHLRWGLYFYYLEPWLELFSKEQILVLESEDLFQRPLETVNRVFSFLEIEPLEKIDQKWRNPGRRLPMDHTLRLQLSAFFQPHDRLLEQRLNRKFRWNENLLPDSPVSKDKKNVLSMPDESRQATGTADPHAKSILKRFLVSKACDRIRFFTFRAVFALVKFMDPVLKQFQLLRRRIARTIPREADWSPGISIIIPERGGVPMLAECLESLFVAIKSLHEPSEVIVVVNGSPLADYKGVGNRFRNIRWIHSTSPLGFSSAIRRGVKAARYDWVYLLNNDMILAPDALEEVMKWRAPHVFSVGSQIFFKDPAKRRQETGWTDMKLTPDCVEIYEIEPEDQAMVRGGLYSGGGSSLFRKQLLESLLPVRDPYHPFYWEDAEWGFRAWKRGYEVLFCPLSKVWHHHRGTVSKYYEKREIDRIFERNRIQFQLRNLPESCSIIHMAQKLNGLDRFSRREITGFKNSIHLLKAQIETKLHPYKNAPMDYIRRKFYTTPFIGVSNKKSMIAVSPFGVFPPSHGGAVRMHHLFMELGKRYNLILLSDEQDLYAETSLKYFKPFSAVHLIGGRKENIRDRSNRTTRIQNHSHAKMQRELLRLIHCYRPDFIHIEYIECAALIDQGKRGIRWGIDLQDVLLSDCVADAPTPEDRYEISLIDRFDAVFACSREDFELLPSTKKHLAPNGARLGLTYQSSAGKKELLFMGPFRYLPNLDGIIRYLECVHPELRRRIPDVSLSILGGHDANMMAKKHDCFAQESVAVFDYVEDVQPWLQKCALTINPQFNTRGSSVKLIQSIAAGRICIATEEGARGFIDAGFPSLMVCKSMDDFVDTLESLLLKESLRLSLEKPPMDMLEKFSWAHTSEIIHQVYQEL